MRYVLLVVAALVGLPATGMARDGTARQVAGPLAGAHGRCSDARCAGGRAWQDSPTGPSRPAGRAGRASATAPLTPGDITRGPDGNLWFTRVRTNSIGRITPRGSITLYRIPTPRSMPLRIARGPDGNLWFTENAGNRIGRITPSGRLIEFPLPTAGSRPWGITAGSDGNVWFVEQGTRRIGRITPRGVLTEFPLPGAGGAAAKRDLRDITAGPDGNLWFTDGRKDCCFGGPAPGHLGRITPRGAINEYTMPAPYQNPLSIVAGPAGSLWFTETVGNSNRIGRIDPRTGRVRQYVVPNVLVDLWGLTAGPDGNIWYTLTGGNVIGRITPRGNITQIPLKLRAQAFTNGPTDITAGPDGNLWFMELTEQRIGRTTLSGHVVEYTIPS